MSEMIVSNQEWKTGDTDNKRLNWTLRKQKNQMTRWTRGSGWQNVGLGLKVCILKIMSLYIHPPPEFFAGVWTVPQNPWTASRVHFTGHICCRAKWIHQRKGVLLGWEGPFKKHLMKLVLHACLPSFFFFFQICMYFSTNRGSCEQTWKEGGVTAVGTT